MQSIAHTKETAPQGRPEAQIGHWQKRKTVHILCNIPLDIPVDELVTWRDLTWDGRLDRALEVCGENGWEALPLAAKELTRLFPDLWRTRKAAEDWARKNPLNPLLSIIRLWGVLNTYRPPGQTRWSKALVRHAADPRMALAAVLGVAAEDIQVREAAGTGSGPVRLNPAAYPLRPQTANERR